MFCKIQVYFPRYIRHCSPGSGQTVSLRWFGQPAYQTHPHLVQEGEVTPRITKDEFRVRRHNLMQKIAESSYSKQENQLVVIPSATKAYMSHDIPYTFRQNTDFLYLCGFQEPDSVLILQGRADSLPNHTATLFVPKKDPHRELWEGPRTGKQCAIELTGVGNADNTEELPNFFKSYMKSHNSCILYYNYKKPPHLAFHLQYMNDFIKENKYGFTEIPTALIHSLRIIKSDTESDLMLKSNQIASAAFKDVMEFSKPDIAEAHLYAKMDFECRLRGAEYLAYPPVVAGGNRANTIHYVNNNQIVCDGEMVLMDAGCEYHGYTSDITRTWPVSGEFLPAQRALYEAVLEVQHHCIHLCSDQGRTLNDIYHEMLMLLGIKMRELGVLRKDTQDSQLISLARKLCPHHVGHYLGMDVHDTDEITRNTKLSPGMIVTIEPGVYIPGNDKDVPKEFRGNGIRIEDNILIGESGYTNLTSDCPKDPGAIEAVIRASERTGES